MNNCTDLQDRKTFLEGEKQIFEIMLQLSTMTDWIQLCQLIIIPDCTKYTSSQICNSAIQPNSPGLSIRCSCKTTAILRWNHRAVSTNSGQTDRHVLSTMINWLQLVRAKYSKTKNIECKFSRNLCVKLLVYVWERVNQSLNVPVVKDSSILERWIFLNSTFCILK